MSFVTTLTATNLLVEGNSGYLAVTNTIQYSYVFLKFRSDSATDTLTSVTINGTNITGLIGVREDYAYNLSGKTGSQIHDKLVALFPTPTYNATPAAATCYLMTDTTSNANDKVLILASYAKNVAATVTYGNVPATAVIVISSTGGSGPTLISAQGITTPGAPPATSGGPVFAGTPAIL